MALAWDTQLTRVWLPGSADLPADAGSPPELVRALARRIQLHYASTPQDFRDVPLQLEGVPPFAAKVYRALHSTAPGTTLTYAELAARAGSPGATRAVGTAMANNPWPLIVPCHRVFARGGKLGGYSGPGGLVTKVDLLAREGLHIDPVTQISVQDPRFARHLARVGACTMQITEPDSVFAALLRSIVYQQLAGKAAKTIFDRVRALYPKGRLTPEHTARLSDEALLGAGLSRNKLLALRDLAARAIDGSLPTLDETRALDDEALITRLSQVRGIGRWSVQMFAMFSLGLPDIMPLGDLGIQKGFAAVFGTDDVAVLAARAERWRPFRSIAAWYLWRATELQQK